mgnify:CR=1 FL=1
MHIHAALEAEFEKQYDNRKLRGPTVSRSFCIIFEENYCSFLILEAGIFFMAAESRAWGSWAP